MLAYRVNCISKIVRVAALAVRDSNGLELGRELRLIHDAAFRQLMNERPQNRYRRQYEAVTGYLFRRHDRLSFVRKKLVVNLFIMHRAFLLRSSLSARQ